MVEAVKTPETPKTPEMTKRARWKKIKGELLKLPKNIPEIVVIAINIADEGIIIVTEPVSADFNMSLYSIGRNLKYKYGFPFENFSIKNLAHYRKDFPWKESLLSGHKTIYERPWHGK